MEDTQRNIHISGSGSVDAGEYGEISISGSASANGDIRCEKLRVSGSGRFQGKVDCAGEMRVSGSASVNGTTSVGNLYVSGALNASDTLRAGALYISGSVKAAGDVEADEAKISGGGKLGGALRGRTIHLSGSLSVENGVECETLEMSGGFTANGLMNAETVCIRIGGRCRADEIGGETIDVRRGEMTNGILGALFASIIPERCLEANVIEGTNVYLEATRASAVRGRRVEIGPGCHIERVEYSESLTVDPSSEVQSQSKTEA